MSGRMRSRCQDNAKPMSRYCEADVKANAKPMSRRMRSRCQGDREADVEKAFTRAHAEWKYTRTQRVPCELGGIVSRASWVGTCPVRVRPRSRYREGVHTRTRWMKVHTHTNKLTPNGNTQSDMFYLCLHWLLAFILLLWQWCFWCIQRAKQKVDGRRHDQFFEFRIWMDFLEGIVGEVIVMHCE